jgi:hypothetical protein
MTTVKGYLQSNWTCADGGQSFSYFVVVPFAAAGRARVYLPYKVVSKNIESIAVTEGS